MADHKQWADMSREEREAFKTARKAQAIDLVRQGGFPAGIMVKVGDHTLTLRPSGVSDRGSVAYSLSPTILETRGKHLRINKVSISVLAADAPDDVVEGDIL